MTTTLPPAGGPVTTGDAPQPPVRRRLLSTTPGQLRVESIAVLAVALLAGLLAALVIGDQTSNTARIAEESEPVIVSARRVQTSLAEANAAAATAFLSGGVENADKRADYETAMDTAAIELERAASLVGDDDISHDALRSMTAGLPRYSGLIESARANNRQGFPVGAAYLESATRVLQNEIYPATDVVANQAAAQYRNAYDRQRGLALGVGVLAIVLVLAVVAALVYVQFQLRQRFNRTLNLPLVAATVLAVGLGLWMSVAIVTQFSSLTAARTDGYEATRLYLDVRGTGFGARADEARFLIARGAGAAFEEDFTQRATMIDEMRADLEDHAADTADTEAAQFDVEDTYRAWSEYTAIHADVVAADLAGQRDEAVTAALGPADAAFAAFDETTLQVLEESQARFDTEMADAARATRFLQIGSLVLAVLIGGLAMYGIQLRINEYR